MFKKLVVGLISILAIGILAFVIWAETPLQPMDEALQALQSTDSRTVQQEAGWIAFEPSDSQKLTGLIFYPGGRVDYRAYAPLLAELADQGYPAYLVKMPFNLAVFGIDRADAVINAHPEVEQWIIGGHSLGGAMATQFASDHTDQVEGVLLLAAYATEGSDLSQSGLPVVSISGDLDGLATPAKVASAAQFLPTDTQWIVISGGNHAQMGWYGPQNGDNPAAISRVDQQNQIAAAIKALLTQIEEE